MSLSEDKLCQLFAERVKDSPELTTWVLLKTKFSAFANSSRLLHEEQRTIRPRKHWWRHWWCNAPGLRKAGRETDIFMIFEAQGPNSFRFALHFENKLGEYHFSEGQAEDYRPRAEHMLNRREYLDHSDFATILLATTDFRSRFPKECDEFDAFISHEEIAAFLPEFDIALK